MKDTKSLTLLLLSSVLFLLSIILLCTWGYQYYHQIQVDKSQTQQTTKTAAAVADATRDSLLKIYKVTLNSLDNRADTAYYIADSLNGQLNVNLQEFYRLRDEIAALLQSQTPKTEDLLLARKKITELQGRVEQLRYRNTDVEAENRRLKAVIEQLSKSANGAAVTTAGGGDAVQEYIASSKNNASNAAANASGSIVAANLSLTAVKGADENLVITNEANGAQKLVGSFLVKNNSLSNHLCDLVVVVLDPSGRVIQKSAWESGAFETRNGRKIYSVKLRCETNKGESRQLNFSLNADNYPKGSYTMQVYHDGVLIGRVSKSLS
jgi:flagellar motility protein MotE (MotC chaperone)